MATRHPEAYREMIAKLRQARLDAGMTQTQVAEILKEPQTWVSKVELGERRIDPLELVELAGLYGRRPAHFLPEPDIHDS